MDFLFRGKASRRFLLTKFVITLLLESLLYLETGKTGHFSPLPGHFLFSCLLNPAISRLAPIFGWKD